MQKFLKHFIWRGNTQLFIICFCQMKGCLISLIMSFLWHIFLASHPVSSVEVRYMWIQLVDKGVVPILTHCYSNSLEAPSKSWAYSAKSNLMWNDSPMVISHYPNNSCFFLPGLWHFPWWWRCLHSHLNHTELVPLVVSYYAMSIVFI